MGFTVSTTLPQRALAVALLLGTALVGIGAVVHPVLPGDPAAQLELIAATAHWRTIHLLMLTGSGLVIAGIWVRLIDRPVVRELLIAALVLVTVGLALNSLNIAYMAASGTLMAELFQAGRSEIAGVYEVTHPIGLMAARFGNLLIALGALTLGWSEWQDSDRPRWLAVLAWLAAVGGLAGAFLFNETSRFVLSAAALLSGWQIATGVRALK